MIKLNRNNLNDYLKAQGLSKVFYLSDYPNKDVYAFKDYLTADITEVNDENIYRVFSAINVDCDAILIKGNDRLVYIGRYIAYKLKIKCIVDGEYFEVDGLNDPDALIEEIKEKEEDIKEKLKNIKLFVLDMDGTIYLDGELFSFTKNFLESLRSSGRDYCFYTNNSSKNKTDYLIRLENLGIPVAPERMLLSTEVIIEYLLTNYSNDKKYYVVGTTSLINSFKEEGLTVVEEDPDIVILGFDTTLTYDKLVKACHYIRNGALYYGVNPDYNCPMKNGTYIPDCGSIAKLIERSTDRFPEFFGKPSRHTLEYIKKVTGYKEEEIAFVGDRIYTDIKVTKNSKATSIMVLTGESKREDIYKYSIVPDITVESLETLIQYL